jgi:hypothetical protein
MVLWWALCLCAYCLILAGTLCMRALFVMRASVGANSAWKRSGLSAK